MPCFTAMRAEIALMSGSAFAVTHHAFSSGAGRTSDGNGSHASTLKSPSYTKSVSWQHYRPPTELKPSGARAIYPAFVTRRATSSIYGFSPRFSCTTTTAGVLPLIFAGFTR
ncbi:putative IS1 encoded protein [Shigella dysenteriae 225-75]|nr:putative IS1 encoded protein [Shigella dysenteriae 225-75]